MAAFLDLCRFNTTSGGTGDWIYSSEVTGCQSPAAAGAVDGRKYKFLAISPDQTQWELAEGAYSEANGAFARTTVLYNSAGTGSATGQSGAGVKINFFLPPTVAIVALKEDLISVEEPNTFTPTQQAQARSNTGSIGGISIQKFTASGTYTPAPGMKCCVIECVGGGGGGGGCAVADTNQISYGGGGGGAGSYSRKIASASDIGVSLPVTIGAAGAAGMGGINTGQGGNGGTTSVGNLCVANGGAGGVWGGPYGSTQGGAGGVAGSGDFVVPGSSGSNGIATLYPSSLMAVSGGGGGASYFGGAPRGAFAGYPSTSNGVSAAGYGNGGGGSAVNNIQSTPTNGGAGAPGIVIITEYF